MVDFLRSLPLFKGHFYGIARSEVGSRIDKIDIIETKKGAKKVHHYVMAAIIESGLI